MTWLLWLGLGAVALLLFGNVLLDAASTSVGSSAPRVQGGGCVVLEKIPLGGGFLCSFYNFFGGYALFFEVLFVLFLVVVVLRLFR